MLKVLKIKFKKRRVKPKCSIDKKTKILPILYQFHHQNLNVVLSDKQYCYQENQILPTITRFYATNIALKRRWQYFLVLMNHYHQTKYICLKYKMITFSRVY